MAGNKNADSDSVRETEPAPEHDSSRDADANSVREVEHDPEYDPEHDPARDAGEDAHADRVRMEDKGASGFPDEQTPGIFDPPHGQDPKKWRQHVQFALRRKRWNLHKIRMDRMFAQYEQEWKDRTNSNTVHPHDIVGDDMFDADDIANLDENDGAQSKQDGDEDPDVEISLVDGSDKDEG